MTLAETITAAIRDLSTFGYDSAERVAYWSAALRKEAEAELTPPHEMEQQLRKTLGAIYHREVEAGGLARKHPDLARYTIDRVRPDLRAELDRRLAAARDLIRLNRAEAITKMEQRFQGWATSLPAGGSKAVERLPEKVKLRKSVTALPFHERRLLIDQGHKLNAALSETVAMGNGAIAGEWHSHWRQPGYNYRPDHKERDQEVYAVRGNWALEKGLMNKGAGYTDDITRPGEEPYCRCNYRWIFALRDLPPDMLTNRGADALTNSKVA